MCNTFLFTWKGVAGFYGTTPAPHWLILTRVSDSLTPSRWAPGTGQWTSSHLWAVARPPPFTPEHTLLEPGSVLKVWVFVLNKFQLQFLVRNWNAISMGLGRLKKLQDQECGQHPHGLPGDNKEANYVGQTSGYSKPLPVSLVLPWPRTQITPRR